MSDTLNVKITTGPHGKNTVLEIDGEPVKNARAFVLSSDVAEATTLTVTYVNVHAEVDAVIETTAFESETKTYRVGGEDE